MRKRIFERKKNARRGFTVAEVVVALALIVIISSASMTLISVQRRTEAKSIATVEATNIAENAIECFRYAQNTGAEFSDVFGVFIGHGYLTKNENNEKFTVSKNGATVEIQILDANADGTNDTIEIRAQYAGENIFEDVSYTKK